MNVLARKLRRELWSSKGTLLAITSILALGVMCFIYMRSTYFNLSGARDRYYVQCRMADFWLDLKRAPLADLARLRELPEVLEIRPRITFSATVDLDDVIEPMNGLVLSLPDQREPILNDIVLRRGDYFSDRRDNEVLVSDAFARARNLRPGDRLHLLLNNRRQELHVVGTVLSSEFVYLIPPGAIAPDPLRYGIFYVKHSFAEDVFDMDGAANQVVGVLAPDTRQHPQAFLDRARRLLEPYGIANAIARKDQASNMVIESEIRGVGIFAAIFPAVILAVAALLLNVLLSRLVEQQRTVIGALKAIGYYDAQIFRHYLAFGLFVGVIAGLLGCLGGYRMAEWLTTIYVQFYEFPDLTNRLYAGTYLGGLSFALGCAGAGSWHGARQALRLRPAEAMRPKPPARGGKVWLERIGWMWTRLTFSWRMALRNLIRNRLRTGVGLFAAATGASLLATGLTMAENMKFLVNFQFNEINRADYDLTLQAERGRDAVYEAQRLPGVDAVEPFFGVACTFRHGPRTRQGAITALTPGARLTIPRDIDGRAVEIPESGLLLTRKMAQLLGAEVGDRISVTPTRGRRHTVDAPVVGVSESFLGTAVYADLRYASRLMNEEFVVTGLQLATDPTPGNRVKLLKELKQLPAIQTVNARSDAIHNLNETIIKTQRLFIGIITMFAGILFCGSILNASLVSLSERQREIATLRVLGYGPWQIGGLLWRESFIVNVLGTLLGIPLGYALNAYLVSAYDTDMFRVPLRYPPWIWGVTVVMGIVFALMAQAVVQQRIGRQDWLEALKVKE